MTNIDEPDKEEVAVGVDSQKPEETRTPAAGASSGTGLGVSAIARGWSRENLIRKGSLVFRGLALLFSLLALILMASNKHDDWKHFDRFEEYRYLLAIAILSTLYTGAQTLRYLYEKSTGKELLDRRSSALIDFTGDQVAAYLLISAASAAIPLTNRFREQQDDIFTDSSASSISMALLAFILLSLSALTSGYKLITQTYV